MVKTFLRFLIFVIPIISVVPIFSMEEQLKVVQDKLIKENKPKNTCLDKALEDSLLKDIRNVVSEYANDWYCSKEITGKCEIHKIKQLPDGKLIYSIMPGLEDPCIKVVDPSSGDSYNLIELEEGSCMEFDFSGNQFAYNSGDDVKTLNLTSGSVEDFPTGHENIVKELHFLGPSKLVSGSFDNNIKIWDVPKKECINTLSEHFGPVGVIKDLSKDMIISGSGDKTIKVWDLRKGTGSIKTFKGHTSGISGIVILSDVLIASCSFDKTIKIWDISTGKCLKTLYNEASINSLAKLLNGTSLVSGSGDSKIRIWDINSGECVNKDLGVDLDQTSKERKNGHSRSVVSLCSLKDGQIASGSWDASIKIWSNPVCSEAIEHENRG